MIFKDDIKSAPIDLEIAFLVSVAMLATWQ